MRRCNRRCHPPVNLSCFVVWDCRQSPATPQALAVYSLVLHMLAISHHGPFSEYELTAENEPPSLFHSLARQEAVPAAVLEHQTPAQGLLPCSGTFGWRWWMESQHWKSHYTLVLKTRNKKPKPQLYRGLSCTKLDGRHGSWHLKPMIAALSALHSAISQAKLINSSGVFQKPTCYELIRCQIVPMPSPEIISGLEFMLHPIMQLQIPSQLTPRACTLSFQWLCIQGRCWHHATPHTPSLD